MPGVNSTQKTNESFFILYKILKIKKLRNSFNFCNRLFKLRPQNWNKENFIEVKKNAKDPFEKKTSERSFLLYGVKRNVTIIPNRKIRKLKLIEKNLDFTSFAPRVRKIRTPVVFLANFVFL